MEERYRGIEEGTMHRRVWRRSGRSTVEMNRDAKPFDRRTTLPEQTSWLATVELESFHIHIFPDRSLAHSFFALDYLMNVTIDFAQI